MTKFKLMRYPGGKSRQSVRDLITSYFPDSFGEYREPFVGGGSVFGSVDPAKARWVNDANEGLIAVYRALRDNPDEFIRACLAIEPAREDEPYVVSGRGTRYNKRLYDFFHRLVRDDSAELALRYFFLNRMAFNGRVLLSPERRARMHFSNPMGWNIVRTGALTAAAEKLAGVTITAGDYAPLLSTPGDDCLVYADPPYWKDTILPKSAKLYEIGFSMDDHVRFRDTVFSSPHRVVVSYDDCEFVRDLWRGCFIHEAAWHYSGTVGGRRRGNELLITNYRPARTCISMASTTTASLPDGATMDVGSAEAA